MKFIKSLPLFLFLIGCGAQPITVNSIQTQLQVTDPAPPAPVNMAVPHFYVITNSNITSFMANQATVQGTSNPVVIAVTPSDYENIMLNYSDLERYFKQEQAINSYYQTAIASAQKAVDDANSEGQK
jgi:hypothetical protein